MENHSEFSIKLVTSRAENYYYTFGFVISVIFNNTSGISVCTQSAVTSIFPMLMIIRILKMEASCSFLFCFFFGCFLLTITCSTLFRRQNFHMSKEYIVQSFICLKAKLNCTFGGFIVFSLITLNFLLNPRIFTGWEVHILFFKQCMFYSR